MLPVAASHNDMGYGHSWSTCHIQEMVGKQVIIQEDTTHKTPKSSPALWAETKNLSFLHLIFAKVFVKFWQT